MILFYWKFFSILLIYEYDKSTNHRRIKYKINAQRYKSAGLTPYFIGISISIIISGSYMVHVYLGFSGDR